MPIVQTTSGYYCDDHNDAELRTEKNLEYSHVHETALEMTYRVCQECGEKVLVNWEPKKKEVFAVMRRGE